ncbi:MAG: zinc-binding dehydrogenase, partial [Gemmatimonadetes bacterium]|nr:zinc-binding dehydrogenase [Gemmatimonadota bacterium]
GGGVGSLALQIVKAHGARVTAVDSTGKLEVLRTLGADDVIDFTRRDFTRLDARYDLIFDVPGNRPFPEIRRVLKADGRYVPIGHQHFTTSRGRAFGLVPHFFRLMFLSRFVDQLRGPRTPMPTRQEAMAVLRELLEAGTITPIIDSTFPLGAVRAAFRHMIEEEPRGKVMLVPTA